ncbi:MAG: cobalt ECF transporter T component CbiQ [Blastocatellia bacterium]
MAPISEQLPQSVSGQDHPASGGPGPIANADSVGLREGKSTENRHRKHRASFIERTLKQLLNTIEHSLHSEQLSTSEGLLQSLDPRAKVIGLLALIISAALSHRVTVIAALLAIAVLLALLSRVPVGTLVTRVWAGAFLFTGAIAVPAIFITAGRTIYTLPLVHWTVTEQGIRSATYLVGRVETAATYSILLILCTPWTHVLKALRVLGVPVVIVVILGMTYRFIFLLTETARDMFESRQSRIVGRLEGRDRRRIAASSAGALLSKSMHLSNEVYLAMRSRGFRGEVYTVDEFNLVAQDVVFLASSVVVAGAAFWLGR